MFIKGIWKYIVFAFCLYLFSCDEQTHVSDQSRGINELHGQLDITGSSTIAPLAHELAKAFEGLHPDVRINVQTGGSSRGIADVRQQISDIGMVSRALKSAENDLSPFPVARDGIALVVHQSNPIKELNNEQIKSIFQKQISNWRELGGEDAPITVVNKADGRSTLELFLAHFELKNSEIRPDVVIGDNAQGIKTVAGNPNAIGYVSIGSAEVEIELGSKIKLLSLNGITADSRHVSTGEYPLSRELNFVTEGRSNDPLIQAFYRFARSSETKNIIASQGFVAIAP